MIRLHIDSKRAVVLMVSAYGAIVWARLADVVAWSWYTVLSPLWFPSLGVVVFWAGSWFLGLLFALYGIVAGQIAARFDAHRRAQQERKRQEFFARHRRGTVYRIVPPTRHRR